MTDEARGDGLWKYYKGLYEDERIRAEAAEARAARLAAAANALSLMLHEQTHEPDYTMRIPFEDCQYPSCRNTRAALADVRDTGGTNVTITQGEGESHADSTLSGKPRIAAPCGCVHRDHGGERCDCCGLPSHVGFSVPNDVWVAAGNHDGTLCIMCFVARAEACDVEWCQWINWWPVCEIDARKGDEAARQVMQPEEGTTARPDADDSVARAALAAVASPCQC